MVEVWAGGVSRQKSDKTQGHPNQQDLFPTNFLAACHRDTSVQQDQTKACVDDKAQ